MKEKKNKTQSRPIDASSEPPRVVQSHSELPRFTQSCPELLRGTPEQSGDGTTDGPTDIPSHRDARTPLKSNAFSEEAKLALVFKS